MNYFLKRLTSGTLAVLMIASLAACGPKKEPVSSTEESSVSESSLNSSKESSEESSKESDTPDLNITTTSINTKQLSADLKEKYAEEAPVNYLTPMNDIAQDQVLRLPMTINPEELGLDNLSEFAAVYTQLDLETPMAAKIEYDEAAGELLLHPPYSAAFSPTDESKIWGYAPQYYAAYFYNPATGEKLDKPSVMQFTVENDITSPYLEFDKSKGGYASFKWNEIEEADKYHLYALSDYNSPLHWDVAEDLTENFYTDEFKDTYGTFTQLNAFLTVMDDGTSVQRYFYLIAEKDGEFSRASNLIDIDKVRHQLPYILDSGSDTTLEAMVPREISVISAFVDVAMCDGKTSVRYPVTYQFEDREVVRLGDYINFDEGDEVADDLAMHFTFTVDGTGLEGHTYVKKYDYPEFDAELEAVMAFNETLKGKATADKEVTIDFISEEEATGEAPKEESSEVESSKEESSKEESSKEESSKEESSKEESSKEESSKEESSKEESSKEESSKEESSKEESSKEESSKEESSKEESSKEESYTTGEGKELVMGEFTAFSTTAMGEYLAINMLNGEELIDMTDFPEARDTDMLMDALLEAIYQNPLVLSVDGVGATPNNTLVQIRYGQDKTELREKQAEIVDAVNEIVAEIITDDMTDLEKEVAINDYLCESAEYDFDALDYAMANDMKDVGTFTDSFTPYGILVNKVGVCASYAGSFKLLADAAGLETVVVTGFLNGNLPHAWNRVNIDGEWMSIDSTNNDTPQLYNYMFNLPDEISETTLVEDTDYMMDNKLSKYKGTTNDLEYYRISDQYYSAEEIAAPLAEMIADGSKIATLRTDYNVSDDQMVEIFAALMSNPILTDMQEDLLTADVYATMGMISIVMSAE